MKKPDNITANTKKSKKNYHRILLSFLMLAGISCFSQDLIMMRDSSRVFCRITREDSATLYYIPVRDKKQTELSIKKADVIKYYTPQMAAKEERERKAEAERKYREKEKIYQAKELKVGMYRSFREYFTNSPSITRKFTVEERGPASLALAEGNPFILIVPDSAVDEIDIKGFCDGREVFYKYQVPKGYCRFEYIGLYSFFHSKVHGSAISTLLPEQLIIVDEQGTFTAATPKYLKKLLESKSPELAKKFDEEENQRDKMKEYVIRLNEKLLGEK